MKRARRGNRTTKEGHAASSGEVRKHEVGADQIGRELNRRRWQISAAVLLIVIASGLGWWKFSNRVPSIPIPEISLQEAAPSVREAITAARNSVQTAPRSATAWGDLGMLLFAHQFESEANLCLTQAERLDPSDVRWPYLLGVSLSVSDSQVAEAHFRRALELQDFPAVHLRLGELHLRSQELAKASEHFEAASRGDGSDPRVHYDLARVSLAKGDLSTARRSAEQAVKLAPETKSVRELLATILQQQGDRHSANIQLTESEQAAEVTLGWKDPIAGSVMALRRDVSSLLEQADELLAAGEIQQGVNLLVQSLNVDDRDPRVYTRLAKALINAQQVPEAHQLLLRAETRHPQVAEIHFQKGNTEFFMQQWKAAEQSFRVAVSLQPNFTLAHYNLGHVLLKLNRDSEALESFEAAAKLRPEYSDAHLNAAKLWHKQGNREKAKYHLLAARRSKPDDRELKELLEQVDRP